VLYVLVEISHDWLQNFWNTGLSRVRFSSSLWSRTLLSLLFEAVPDALLETYDILFEQVFSRKWYNVALAVSMMLYPLFLYRSSKPSMCTLRRRMVLA
jgi:hypothetical protein